MDKMGWLERGQSRIGEGRHAPLRRCIAGDVLPGWAREGLAEAMRTSRVENDPSEPGGWRHVLYAFVPWVTGAALVLFSVLMVAYENRYRSAVRHEIETRVKGKQQAAALVTAYRLQGYLGDVTSKLRLISRLTATQRPADDRMYADEVHFKARVLAAAAAPVS